jgi:hypothetical protein
MKKNLCIMFAIFVIVSTSDAGPLLWRGAKTINPGKPIFMVSLGYTQINKSWNWTDEEWTDISDNNQTTVITSHFMLGFAPMAKWEVMAHIPFMSKSRDTLSSFGLQDVWLKTRYNFIGGQNQPYFTGVAALRIPTSSEDAEILLDDRTLDIALGILFMHTIDPFVLHIKAGYWYNMKTDADIDIGDDIEAIFKVDYIFNKQVKAFLNFTLVETMKAKDADGNSINNSEKRRFTITPGLLISPAKGFTVRPKFIYPLEMLSRGGSDFSWKIGLDIWFVP